MELPSPVIASDYIYRTYWLYWRLLGVEGEHPLRYLLLIMQFFFVTIWYPIHLIVGLICDGTLAEVCRGIPITASCFFSSFKIICFRWKLAEIKKVQQLFMELDQRIATAGERSSFYRETIRVAEFIWKSLLVAAILAIITGTAFGLFRRERKLLYPGWFPYDVYSSDQRFWLSFAYQAAGHSLAILQNLANDSYPPMTFCVLAGHVRLLSMRLSRMGYDLTKPKEIIVRELKDNIEDYRKLMNIVQLLRSTMHLSQLGQFISSGINIAITLVNILFFADNNFAMTYYGVYFMAMLMEIFPSCYYGTLISIELNGLTDSIFSSNWVGMDRGYCRTLLIFMQLTLAKVEIRAGGMIGISLNAFFATIRMAYSFFTLAMSLRK
ncbi:odorant receptor 33b-like [Drosophila miranda]|uniref:odorant receptor 33b-like n=1 Tax=Drosophila miranda TaxID=7229 RepID=UPI0007E703B6|nr:odorant receptor 33b-like [Drosophila miranda]